MEQINIFSDERIETEYKKFLDILWEIRFKALIKGILK